uniref:Uncharacterized protein n=1 Tax=Nelumbo nucifera TaxID=4432 RepID=A0A822ZG19_NELNU|nr:TPA_asm: hypothetical protein HUJ06_000595 [Nelumbo nucifera]
MTSISEGVGLLREHLSTLNLGDPETGVVQCSM